MNYLKLILTTVLISAIAISGFSQSSVDGRINSKEMQKIISLVKSNSETQALTNAISNNEIKKLAINRENAGKVNHLFTNKVETKGITNQKSSGRCWLFTGLNTLRPIIINKLKLNEFEFSENYSFFWDQFEKANLFLEGIIMTRDKADDDRTVDWFFKGPINDGGQWTTFAGIITKYGLVPKSAMPETYHSSNTSWMSRMIKRKLREDGVRLREMNNNGKNLNEIREEKLVMLSDIYKMLVFTLGEPPAEFTWQYENTDKVISEEKTYTPKQFLNEYIGIDFGEYVMFMNDPTRPYNKLYEVEFDRNLVEGNNWKYINLPSDKIKEFAKASIINSEKMYFSCDVGKQLNTDIGTLDLNNYNYDDLFGVKFGMTKAERIKTHDSGSSHGMTLSGANIDKDGNIDKWLLENSWGLKRGHKGYLTMTDEWFDEYMFRLVINKKYLDKKTLKILKQEPTLLPPWDPMFAPEK